MNKKTAIVVSIIVLVIIGGGAFYGGIAYGKSQKTIPAFNPGNANFQGARPNKNSTGGNFVSGEIISRDDTSITIKLPNDAGTKIIFYSAATQVNKFASGSPSDLSTGNSVTVTGTTNSDGSVSAQSIQLRPAGQNEFAPSQK